jgi:hypothetical protein
MHTSEENCEEYFISPTKAYLFHDKFFY